MTGGLGILLRAGLVLAFSPLHETRAAPLLQHLFGHKKTCEGAPCCDGEGSDFAGPGGTWYWMRSPDEERRVTAGLYNRYCIRCHGVDGRGVWDIPGVPDFTNTGWQASRTDGDLARIIIEGRGAVMPPFRGTLSLEEAWAMGRYLRTFVPGSETSRPDFRPSRRGNVETLGRPRTAAMLPE
jgi:hypothetical protein